MGTKKGYAGGGKVKTLADLVAESVKSFGGEVPTGKVLKAVQKAVDFKPNPHGPQTWTDPLGLTWVQQAQDKWMPLPKGTKVDDSKWVQEGGEWINAGVKPVDPWSSFNVPPAPKGWGNLEELIEAPQLKGHSGMEMDDAQDLRGPTYFGEDTHLKDMLEEAGGWRQALANYRMHGPVKEYATPEEFEAVDDYAGPWSGAINKLLRDPDRATAYYGTGEAGLGSVPKKIELLDQLVARTKLLTPLRLFRGIYSPDATKYLNEEPGFGSWSIDPTIARSFAGSAGQKMSHIFRLDVPPGVRGVPLNAVGSAPREYEVLMPRGHIFEQTGDEIVSKSNTTIPVKMKNEWAEGGKVRGYAGGGKVDDFLRLFRGIRSDARLDTLDPLLPRENSPLGYFSSSPHVASTYANPIWEPGRWEKEQGAVFPVLANPKRIFEYPTRNRSFDMIGFDRAAQGLGPGEGLVARQIQDTGPRARLDTDPDRLWSFPSDTWSFGAGTDVRSIFDNVGVRKKYAEGGSVLDPKTWGDWIAKMGSGEKGNTKQAQDGRRRLLAGFASQVMGTNEKGEARLQFPHLSIGAESSSIEGYPGVIDEALSLPALLPEGVGPAWAYRARERADKMHEQVRQQMGLKPPQGFDENFTEGLGTMLGQIPLPGGAIKHVKRYGKEALEAAELVATSPIEYLTPTIRPSVENYVAGAGAGAGMQTFSDWLGALNAEHDAADEKLTQAYAEGGKVDDAAATRMIDKTMATLKGDKELPLDIEDLADLLD